MNKQRTFQLCMSYEELEKKVQEVRGRSGRLDIFTGYRVKEIVVDGQKRTDFLFDYAQEMYFKIYTQPNRKNGVLEIYLMDRQKYDYVIRAHPGSTEILIEPYLQHQLIPSH